MIRERQGAIFHFFFQGNECTIIEYSQHLGAGFWGFSLAPSPQHLAPSHAHADAHNDFHSRRYH